MPSSPEAVVADFEADAAPARPVAWQPVVLGSPTSAGVGSDPAGRPIALAPALAAPEPFVVSERIGVPAAVLAEAHRLARAQGYAAGFAKGMAGARQRAAAEQTATADAAERAAAAARLAQTQALAALDRARADLTARTAVELAGLERLLLDSAYEIAEALVGATLRDDEARARGAVARVLSLVPSGDGAVTVRLNPADLAVLTVSTAADADVPANVTLAGDTALAPGDAVASAGGATVESRITDGLARVREALS